MPVVSFVLGRRVPNFESVPSNGTLQKPCPGPLMTIILRRKPSTYSFRGVPLHHRRERAAPTVEVGHPTSSHGNLTAPRCDRRILPLRPRGSTSFLILPIDRQDQGATMHSDEARPETGGRIKPTNTEKGWALPFLDRGTAMIGKSAVFASALLAISTLPLGALGQVSKTQDIEVASPRQQDKLDLEQVAKRIVENANQFRQKQGRPKVGINRQLTDAARYFANYLAKSDKFSHTADEKQPAERAKGHGYEYCVVSENMAYEMAPAGFTAEGLAEKFVEGWKQSPEHRKNLLDADVTDTGVAVAQSKETGRYYAVEMFGRPKSMRIEFKIANNSNATVEYQIADRKFSLLPHYTQTHQECLPPEVTFVLPNAVSTKPSMQVVKPSNGDQFVVVEEQGTLRVEKGKTAPTVQR